MRHWQLSLPPSVFISSVFDSRAVDGSQIALAHRRDDQSSFLSAVHNLISNPRRRGMHRDRNGQTIQKKIGEVAFISARVSTSHLSHPSNTPSPGYRCIVSAGLCCSKAQAAQDTAHKRTSVHLVYRATISSRGLDSVARVPPGFNRACARSHMRVCVCVFVSLRI